MDSVISKATALLSANYKALVVLALVVRLVLVVYGSIQDELFEVKYSDVDYAVVTDGARFVLEGGSPYERTTYRYTPLLAYALIPNILLHAAFGKVLFVAFDMLTGWVVYELNRATGLSKARANFGAIVWLWNPLSMTISTRGSGDSIICFLVLATLLGLVKSAGSNSGIAALYWLIFGAIAHGVSVHWRIFPIIFAPAILLFLKSWTERFFFGLVSGATFLLLGVVFFVIYGREFLFETFLYHLGRTDHRHNFSVWFYALYLGLSAKVGPVLSIASFLPQVLVQGAIIRKFSSTDIAYCFFLQTWAFVAFNKVVTAQYFLWYVSLLPVTLFSIDLGAIRFVTTLLLPWIITEVHWLVWGYRVEFLGKSSFEGIFAASILFFLVNVHIIRTLILAHRPSRDNVQGSNEEVGKIKNQ